MQMIISVAMDKESNPTGFRTEKRYYKYKNKKQNEEKRRGNLLSLQPRELAMRGEKKKTQTQNLCASLKFLLFVKSAAL